MAGSSGFSLVWSLAVAGKGDNRRPTAVPHETFASNWEKVFGPKRKKGLPDGRQLELFEGAEMYRFDASLSSGIVNRADGRVERTCVHGIGHTTPESACRVDALNGWEGGTGFVHGCDGCCAKPGFFTKDEA